MVRPSSLAVAWIVAAGGLATVACSKSPEDQPSDVASESRIADLEKKVADLTQQKQGSDLAAGVSGSETKDVRRTLDDLRHENQDLKDRLKALEDRIAKAGSGAAATGTDAAGAPAPTPTTFLPTSDGTFSEDQVAAFRKLSDEVQRRRDAEAQAERVKRELSRAGVTLTPDQEAAVLRLQQTYAEKMRDIFRNGFGTTDAERQATMDKREALRSQFESDLRATVPASEADKIVEAMRRGWPGFFPRRSDARAGGNMDGR